MKFTPCSRRHRVHCSVSHAGLVRGYVEERQRQEIAMDGVEGGELAIWAENGGVLITFKTWLLSHRGPDISWS